MGKRKYEDTTIDDSKKSKSDETATVEDSQQIDNESEVNKKLSKVGGFNVKHFRKELSTKQGQTIALTQFLQVCLDPDSDADYMLQYLKAGGNSHEILKQITQDSKKNLTLATPVFHIFNLVILKVQSSVPHMISITEEACRYFLNTFMSTVEIMISENSGPRHRKIILKLLTSMVTLNPDLGIEVLNQAPLTPKHLQYIVEKVSYKEKDNVRTAFVHFMTSFLVDGHLPLIKALLEKQGLLALVIPGLAQDEAQAVVMFLSILKKNVIENTLISKSLKLKLFSHQVLHNVFKLFSWKGPPDLNYENRNEAKPEIMELVSDILLILFTSHKLGLYFVDNTLGTSDVNKNQNLYKAILTLKRPWENEVECEVILEIVFRCPDLHRALISILEQSFEPQHSAPWEKTAAFTIKLLDKLKPEQMVPKMQNLSPVQVSSLVRFTSLPVPLLKFIQSSLDSTDHVIALYCVKLLVKMLSTIKKYLQIFEIDNLNSHTMDLKNRLEVFFSKHLPAPSSVVSLMNIIMTGVKDVDVSEGFQLTKYDDAESLITLIDLLLLYHELNPTSCEGLEGSLDMKRMLSFSTNVDTGNVSLLKFKVVSLWLTFDSSVISLNNPMFKELFLIMLQVYTCEDDTWIEAKDTVQAFFKNTSIFGADEDEIHVVLYTLRNAKVEPISLVADVVEHVLTNLDELAEYVRTQVVNFEIIDENSQKNLHKLFDDLTVGKNTDDYSFIENKIPSPFIVGCIQYIQTNKDAKKNLKHFLSLYVSNLLHYNYSPEMTEVMMGDCKMDARNYVAGWISGPAVLDESINSKDLTLRNFGLSIIEFEELKLEDVFPFLQAASLEDYDILIREVPFKFVTSIIIDSSELLIWANYLIFCIIRLTKLDQFQMTQRDKILHYFEALLDISKTLHMADVRRIIIKNLLRNPHILSIYSPIDQQKNESNILVTTFILSILEKYSDIIHHFNIKNKLLQPYQQKNYNELVKVFIKLKKKKNINNDHTVRVFEVIGMGIEDDLKILKTITDLDVALLIKEDKEMSVALAVLNVLLMKWSKSDKDLYGNIIKSIMKLYATILKDCESYPNIAILETTLSEYFLSKVHHVKKHVSLDDFKQFFHTNTVSKSMSQLAATILIHNDKFCKVYKEELNRPEILSQRELTLPLGNALIHHIKFVENNKDLLQTIWGEYKTNILKIIEKPNKAGQVYVSNWKFVRKLIIECSEFEDFVRVFGKYHKFDTTELSQIHWYQALFLGMCLCRDSQKKEYLTNYYMTMLNMLMNAIRDGKEEPIVNCIILNIFNTVQNSKIIKWVDTNPDEDFHVIIQSSIWQNFCKVVLKDSLKIKTTADGTVTSGPKLLGLLTILSKTFYPMHHPDISILFDMVTSHSEFLNVMLSHHSSEIKCRLVEFVYMLIARDNTVMKGQQVPVYLSAYHATKSPCDRLILAILQYYEVNDMPVHEYKPYVWGDSAANYYAVRKNRTSSLWGHPTPNQVLNLLEKDVIEKTIKRFPITQKLDYNYGLYDITSDDNIIQDNSVRNVLNKLYKDGLLESVIGKDSVLKTLCNQILTNDNIEQTKDSIDESLQFLLTQTVVSNPHGGIMKHENKTSLRISKEGLVPHDSTVDNETSINNMVMKAKYDDVLQKTRDTDFITLSHGESSHDDEDIYDPAFLFPLLSHLLAPGSVASCFKVFRSGLLAIPVMALGSHCSSMRAAAYHVLHRFWLLLETETKHKNDKLLLTDFIETLRHSLTTAIISPDNDFKDVKNPRLPAIGAMYLARSLLAYTAPFDPLYKPINNFFIAKDKVDLTTVPDFLSLFHDSDVDATARRLWILNIIRDGTKSFADVNVIFKTMCLKMIMDFYSSSISDKKVKEKILEVLSGIASIPRAAHILIEGYSLLPWLDFVIRNTKKDDLSLVKNIITLLGNLLYSLSVQSFIKLIKNSPRNYARNGRIVEEIADGS